MLLQWDQQKYTTGFAHIDEQHRELLDVLNRLIVFLKGSSAASLAENSEKMNELFSFLGEYAGKHFCDEEEVFARYSHPLLEANRQAHQMFLSRHRQYQIKLARGVFSRSLLIQIHIFLRFWMINHIYKIDTALRDCAEKSNCSPVGDETGLGQDKGLFARLRSWFKGH